MSDLHYEERKSSKLPIVALAARITTLIGLAISVGLLKSDSVTFSSGEGRVNFTFTNVQTYRYVFIAMVVVFCYTLLQLPFAMYLFFRKKQLINNSAFLMFEFYGDKACMILLATAVGSLFGATVETKKGSTNIEYIRGRDGKEYDVKAYHSKMREFCMMANISAIFLLIGCCSSIISSVISSRALGNKW